MASAYLPARRNFLKRSLIAASSLGACCAFVGAERPSTASAARPSQRAFHCPLVMPTSCDPPRKARLCAAAVRDDHGISRRLRLLTFRSGFEAILLTAPTFAND